MEKHGLTGASEALFIPLLGKAEGDRWGDILSDPKAKEIVARADYDFSRRKQRKFLSIYMAIRAAILDEYASDFLAKHSDCVVLHLGCGLDSRVERVKGKSFLWVDLDLPDVISVRRRFFREREGYQMLAASVTDHAWLDRVNVGRRPVLVIAEGLTMYLTDRENKALLAAFHQKFSVVDYVFDAYTVSAVRWSRWKNPVNKMGAVICWGLDDPEELERAVSGIVHVETRLLTGKIWEERLSGSTRFWFHVLYGNRWADSLYRIYVFRGGGSRYAICPEICTTQLN